MENQKSIGKEEIRVFLREIWDATIEVDKKVAEIRQGCVEVARYAGILEIGTPKFPIEAQNREELKPTENIEEILEHKDCSRGKCDL